MAAAEQGQAGTEAAAAGLRRGRPTRRRKSKQISSDDDDDDPVQLWSDLVAEAEIAMSSDKPEYARLVAVYEKMRHQAKIRPGVVFNKLHAMVAAQAQAQAQAGRMTEAEA